MDAEHGAAVAGISADAFCGAAGCFWICEPGADALSIFAGRLCGGPLRPASRSDCHADYFHVVGICAGGSDMDEFDRQMAIDSYCVSGGHRQRV